MLYCNAFFAKVNFSGPKFLFAQQKCNYVRNWNKMATAGLRLGAPRRVMAEDAKLVR